MVFPEIISRMPGPSGMYGVPSFESLVRAGRSSLISITQTDIAALQERFGLTRRRSVALAGGGTARGSLVYATGGVITPPVLGWMTIDNLMTEFATPSEGTR